jgi:hypothetical protein
MRYITNSYRDSQILNLGSGGLTGPYLVTQTGVSPKAEIPKTQLFVLRPDGCWADFNAYACQGKPEVMDEIVFTSTAQVMETFGRLTGRPRFADLPVDEQGLKTWIEKQEGRNPLESAQAWAVNYHERHRKQYDRLEGRNL